MRKLASVLVILSLVLFWIDVYAGEVQRACLSASVPVLTLKYRQAPKNLEMIRASRLGDSDVSHYLRKIYSQNIQNEEEALRIANSGNLQFIKGSDDIGKFLQYATSSQRLRDPDGYRSSLIDLYNRYFPGEKNGIAWLLSLKDDAIAFTRFRPADKNELEMISGAKTKLNQLRNGKFSLEVIVSNNGSEPVPYMLTLIGHELFHASKYHERISIYSDKKLDAERSILEEAEANNVQMQDYIKLARQNPKIFCDWLYVSWSYGNDEIPIPLSWAMASKEADMRSGKFIFQNYGQNSKPFLLNEDKTDIRSDLKEAIRKMNLEFLK